MQERTILFVSFTCSGATWLENCLIELNIRVDGIPNILFGYKSDYDALHAEYVLLPSADPSKVGIPAMTFKERFIFRKDIFCLLTGHAVPELKIANEAKSIILVRDPRDTIWSAFHVNSITTKFEEYAILQVMAWKKFYNACLKLPNAEFFKFEDYKKNAFTQLQRIANFADIPHTAQLLDEAVKNSTSEKSKAAEEIYLANTPEEKRFFKTTFNRSGKVAQWKDLPQYKQVFAYIADSTKELMSHFEYDAEYIS